MKLTSTYWGLFAAAVMVPILAGCHQQARESHPASLPTVKVHVAAAAPKSYTATEEVTGTVRSKNRATIEAKVSGKIENMLVILGQVVKEGEPLVQLDAREFQARLDQTKAILDQTRQDRKRFETLLRERAVPQQEYDAVLARARVAEATASEVETMLGYTKILSPFTGVVTRKLADVGDIASPGRALLELEDPAALRLESDLPETLIDRVRLGDKLAVRIAPLTNDIEAVAAELSPAADPASRTFRVKLDLPSATPARLGQFGRVAVPIGELSTLRIPAAACVVRGQMEIVYVVTNQKAQMRLVKTGKRFGGEIEILAGLRAGEQIVLQEAANLLDGQPVEVMP